VVIMPVVRSLIVAMLVACAGAVMAAQPNVLFLAVDDMNDWIGCLEQTPRAITPTIDRLAARGTIFTNAHTAGVFCAPSRAAIFSGQFASTTGCYTTATYFVDHPELEPLQVSFAKAGYTTLGAGKLFHHPAGCIDTRGWTEFFLRSQRQRESGWPLDSWGEDTPFPSPFPHSVYNRGQEIKGGLFLEWAALANDREGEMTDTRRVDWAIEQLQRQHDKPFFLGLGLYAPHYPNYCPRKYFDLYDRDAIEPPVFNAADLDDLPERIRKTQTARSRIIRKLEDLDAVKDAIHGYLACMSYADAMLGRVLDALAASPSAANTIVVLWSDHGYHHGQKGDWGKHTLWDRTSRVPFVWAGPGVVQGQRTNATVSLIDLYPTLVELCDLPAPRQQLEGRSLAGLLAGEEPAADRTILLPGLRPGEFALINEHWRYIRYGKAGEELYDRHADPQEWTNLAKKKRYTPQLERMRQAAPVSFAPPAESLDVGRDLVLEGPTFRWEKGKGSHVPTPEYRPPATPAAAKDAVGVSP
jgi:arylsulfatase A-like enzyme